MSYSQLMDVMLRSHLYILFSVNTNKRWTNIQQKISKQNERWDGSVHTKTYGATIKLIEIYQILAKITRQHHQFKRHVVHVTV